MNKHLPIKLGQEKKQFGHYLEDYLFMSPYLLIFVVFTIVPVITAIYYSFTYFNVIEPAKFIGIGNFVHLLIDDSLFMKSLKNTLLLSCVTGPAGFLLSLLLAWLVNEFGNNTRSFLTLLFYAPVLSGGAYMIWQIIFSGDSYGYLNAILLDLNIIYNPIQWITDENYMLAAAVIVIIWMSFGAGFLSFIAGLKNIDVRLYEAAAIDGIRNRYQELWHITLPSMKPQLMFGAVMSITGSFGMGDVITGLFGFPSTNYALHTLVHHLQDYGNIRFEMGYACAIAVILFLIMIGANMVVQRMLRKIGG
ncbi:MAG: carbohydrate ABC transporter permease [Saccharofermentanales bacterium]